MSTGSVFPLEIYKLIIDEVEDRRTLKACLLVSWAFRHCARRCLFHELELDDDAEATDTFALRDSLCNLMRPSLSTYSGGRSRGGISFGIIPYVRSVKYHINPHDPILDEEIDSASDVSMSSDYVIALPFYQAFVEQMNKTAEVFKLLSSQECSQVRKLFIRGSDERLESADDNRAKWEVIIPSLRQAIINLCRAPKINIIEMCFMENVPRNIFCGSPLKHLCTEHVHFCSVITEMGSALTSPEDYPEYHGSFSTDLLAMPRLESYSADAQKEEMFFPEMWPLNPADTAMKAICIETSRWPEELMDVLQFVTRRFSQLERLILFAHIWELERKPRIQTVLPPPSTLKYLTLEYTLPSKATKNRSFGRIFPTIMARLLSVLRHFRGASILEITFNCAVVFEPYTFAVLNGQKLFALSLKSYPGVDALISDRLAFPSLKNFNFNFRVDKRDIARLRLYPNEDQVTAFNAVLALLAFPLTTMSEVELTINSFCDYESFLYRKEINSRL